MKILDLMNVPEKHQGECWLKASLQTALELELSTLPPYLTAMWSIVDAEGPVYDLIYSIVYEEMLHFGLACNLLTTIGGTPLIADLSVAPKYPGPLPGGVRPGLIVPLVGLTRRLVSEVFMEIEYPDTHVVAEHRSPSTSTIGAFYSAILRVFKNHQGLIKGTKQLSYGGEVPIFAINNFADVRKAIKEIKEQGEGTSKSPQAGNMGNELAHYFKFAEIHHGKELVKHGPGKWKYDGPKIPFPEVYPVAQVPAEGYPGDPDCNAFNEQYSLVLKHLQKAWDTASPAQLGKAIQGMTMLTEIAATKIVIKPLDGGRYTDGPDFRFRC